MTAKKQPNEKDYITNKVLAVFSLCLVGVLGLMMLYRVMNVLSTWMLGMTIAKVVCGIGIVIALAGLAKWTSDNKQQRDTRYSLLRGRSIALVGAVIAVMMFIITVLGVQGIKLFYVILPAIAVYYLIYHSYPREFFVVALDCGGAAVLLWLARVALDTTNYRSAAWGCAAVAVVLAAIQIALVLRVRKTGCKGPVDGRMTELFTAPHAYPTMIGAGILMAALVVIGVAMGAQVAYYLVFAAFACLFVSAVYYTVKML